MMLSTPTDSRAGSRNATPAYQAVGVPVLEVRHLEVTYYTDMGRAKAIDDVSFTSYRLLPSAVARTATFTLSKPV